MSPSALPSATSYEEFAEAFCAAFQAMDRAIGNPDTGEGSELSDALEAAAARRDATAAAELAREVTAELEAGREHAARAGAWGPAREAADHMDQFLVALSAWANAQVEQARGTPGATDPQTALEEAGGLEAWTGMLGAMQSLGEQRPPGPPRECPGVPISL